MLKVERKYAVDYVVAVRIDLNQPICGVAKELAS
jgi:hypothetical protein